jgi:hypothetical protein
VEKTYFAMLDHTYLVPFDRFSHLLGSSLVTKKIFLEEIIHLLASSSQLIQKPVLAEDRC